MKYAEEKYVDGATHGRGAYWYVAMEFVRLRKPRWERRVFQASADFPLAIAESTFCTLLKPYAVLAPPTVESPVSGIEACQ